MTVLGATVKNSLLVLLVLLMICVVSADESFAITKDQEITLVVPTTKVGHDFSNGTYSKFTWEVGLDSEGKLILNQDPDWRLSALPTVLTGTIEKIKIEKKEKLTRLVFYGTIPGTESRRRIVFEIPDGIGDWQSALEEIVITNTNSEESLSIEINNRVTRFYGLYSSAAFSGELESLPDEKKLALIAAVHIAAPGCSLTSETFKGEPYLAVHLGAGTNVYNTLQLNQNQRLAREFTERVFPAIKTIAGVADIEAPYGINLVFEVHAVNFLRKYEDPEIDKVSVFVALGEAKKFAAFEITDQEMVNNSVVIVNDNRVTVSLTDQ